VRVNEQQGADSTDGPTVAENDPAPHAIDIADLADHGLLATVWKTRVRRHLRASSFGRFYLAADPFQFAAYEWNLSSLLSSLVRDLQSGDYMPEHAEIIWSAKTKGLSRPLAFMEPRDALVYRAAVSRVEADLRRGARDWTAPRRQEADRDRRSEPPPDDYETNFFALWLARQGKIASIAMDCAFIVESDIANFFPTVDQANVAEMLLNRTPMSLDLVRLMSHLLRLVIPATLYSSISTKGLPQENLDASRTIAHSLLIDVDKEFDIEGEEGRYTRFMDDVLLGVNTQNEGYEVLSRLQRTLHKHGLYPNSSKTRVVSSQKYLREMMIETNSSIDELEFAIKAHQHGPLHAVTNLDGQLIDAIHELYAMHTEIADDVRPPHWDRILRRIYTLYRLARDDSLLDCVIGHIRQHPDGGRQFLEYVRAFPLSTSIIEQLLMVVTETRSFYEDLVLLICETVQHLLLMQTTDCL